MTNSKMMDNKTSKSSPQLVTRNFCRSIELIERAAGNMTFELDIPNYSMMAIFMTVGAVEAFLNTFFRELVEQPPYLELKNNVLQQMTDRRFGLEQKLRKWPEMFFKKNFINTKPGKAFEEYRRIRNALLHFQHTYEELDWHDTKLIGLTNTSLFDTLDTSYIYNAKSTVCNFYSEIFRMAGHKETQIEQLVRNWTGYFDPNKTNKQLKM
ncbi:hypothetical protein QA601_11225 [Chitinispirillales bacterium ANBcel5]|uniref:hypothetical protein n=1 Tax=Cellulosispirillum alkaliphilum TaxID=3039283 RepID=UPI002A537C54|nr:hypothetical protein [Chitinispirillales bacterium ANBcel5]